MTDIDLSAGTPVLVVGAGIMGAGIAQVAAQAGPSGAPVRHARRRRRRRAAPSSADARRPGRQGQARRRRGAGRARPHRPVAALDEAAGAGLVVEAIVENADAKRALFRELEAIVDERCVLASNTSSISITALANGLKAPGPPRRHALLQPGAADEAGRGRLGPGRPTPAVARGDLRAQPGAGARRRCMPARRRASSSTGSPGRTTPRRSRCCSSAPPSRRRSTPACAAPAFAWGRAS